MAQLITLIHIQKIGLMLGNKLIGNTAIPNKVKLNALLLRSGEEIVAEVRHARKFPIISGWSVAKGSVPQKGNSWAGQDCGCCSITALLVA